MTPEYRSFTPDLEVRSSGDGRTIHGIVVPYNAPTRVNPGLVEQFERGAFNHQLGAPNRVQLEREHVELGGVLIGAGTLMRDDAAGLYMELRVSKTVAGDETLELVKDRALRHLSVAFEPRQNRRLEGGVVARVKADLRKVAVVMQGAYGDLATVGGVRSAVPGALLTPEDLALDAAYEAAKGGLPDLPDTDLKLRAIHLGLTI